MRKKIPEVVLVNGEKVKLDPGKVFEKQSFFRIGQHLIAGIVEDPSLQGFYIWQEVQGVYRRLGSITIREEDGMVIFGVYLNNDTPEFEKRAAIRFAQYGKKFGE